MSNKHLACLLLFGIIVGCAQLALVMNKKMMDARTTQQVAEDSLEQTKRTYSIKETQLMSLKNSTAALRQFLALWLPKFQETNEETNARDGPANDEHQPIVTLQSFLHGIHLGQAL